MFIFSFWASIQSVATAAPVDMILGGAKDAGKVYNPEQDTADVRVIIVVYVRYALGLLGMIFMILIVLAGFKYMSADGKGESTKEALQSIQRAVIGIIIVLSAYGITAFVLSNVITASQG